MKEGHIFGRGEWDRVRCTDMLSTNGECTNLTVCHGSRPLFRILKALLSDLVKASVANHSPKLMLRRTETVAEKMLSNWLVFCLHSYILVCLAPVLWS